jgi:hypothetical protein
MNITPGDGNGPESKLKRFFAAVVGDIKGSPACVFGADKELGPDDDELAGVFCGTLGTERDESSKLEGPDLKDDEDDDDDDDPDMRKRGSGGFTKDVRLEFITEAPALLVLLFVFSSLKPKGGEGEEKTIMSSVGLESFTDNSSSFYFF